MINIISPINSLGYGIAGLNITKHLTKTTDVSLWPIGNPECRNEEDIRILSNCIHNASKPVFDAPCVRIWHQNDMSMFVGNGERIGFPFFELNKFNDVEKHHLNSLDRLFVSSCWAKDVAEQNLSINADKISVVNLGVDPSIFSSSSHPNLEGRKTVFFNCGKWEIRKGHDILVNLFNNAFEKDDDVELWMMTRNPFLSEQEDSAWRKLYSNSKLGDKIKFIDRVATHEEVYNIMAKADCGVFPSKAEGWNLELLEMLACGKSVITTNYSAHTEFCTNENSYLTDIKKEEIAFDGKWFNGKLGDWAKIDQDNQDEMIAHMREVHKLKSNGELKINNKGIETAKKLTWDNSASQIKKILNV